MPFFDRSTKPLLVLWVVGTAIGSVTSIASWSFHMDGAVRQLANLVYMFALPGWVTMYGLGLSGIRDHPLGIISANAIGWAFWCLVILIVWKVRGRWVAKGQTQDDGPENPSRRAFLAHGVLGVGAVGAVASPTYATLVEPWSMKVRRYSIPIKGLPEAFEGLRLVQFSDSHLGPRIPASFVEFAVKQVVGLRPDVLLLTGDYIHDGTGEIDQAAALCKPMIDAARFGAVGVLGNHDWWGDGPAMVSALRAQGVRMIDNARVWLDGSGGGLGEDPVPGGLAFVGLGDLMEDTIDTGRAFASVDESTPRIVLAHHPDTAELPVLVDPGSPRVDLMFSGHTHGGQVRLPFIGTPLVPSRFGSKYAGGLVQGPACPVVVSRGIGMSLLPVRFGVPPEIVEVTLTRA
ncbi:MAG: metallophosphoesterase [Phycisphaerales bacterium JB052]